VDKYPRESEPMRRTPPASGRRAAPAPRRRPSPVGQLAEQQRGRDGHRSSTGTNGATGPPRSPWRRRTSGSRAAHRGRADRRDHHVRYPTVPGFRSTAGTLGVPPTRFSGSAS